ncbi:hypothetical protein [Bosea sp. (in: a-proteobacteria)]|jgi:hypothetical protein|nr:hypothetical protein [Bosea sp. (in: a-proteobacteria)]HEV2509091.1 hypothetical protein [Bosea sp. (in: a-proteobacteria)]
MLERHDCECVLETEHDHEENHEARQEQLDVSETFSPRDHQAGFWS